MQALAIGSACTHPALATDLELASLLREARLRAEHLAREQRRVVAVLGAGGFGFASTAGMTLVRLLPWDSAHFGFPCADLVRTYLADDADPAELTQLLDATVEQARRRGIRMLSARPRAALWRALDHLLGEGFHLVDTSIEIGICGRPLSTPTPAATLVRPARDSDVEALRSLARGFVDNRFHRDPAIPPAKATTLYESWATCALDRVLVIEQEGQVVGLATYAPADDALAVAVVGLVVVHPEARGRGLVGPLLSGCAARAGGQALVTSTQLSNVAALRAFARLGLLPYAARHVLHGWLG